MHSTLTETKKAAESNRDSALGMALRNNKAVQFLEILSVFLAAVIIIQSLKPFVGENPIAHQSTVWVANIVMLALVWLGLRLRGQSWQHLGISRNGLSIRAFLLSLVVFIAAVVAFVLGSIIMANIVGIPEGPNMSGYEYLQGNLPMLIGALAAVFIVSSFGEEVIYRGFLITRISEMGGNAQSWVRIAVFVSAIIFGLVHYEWGAMGMVQTGFMGLALGISFLLVKRNLWVLVLAHAYMDAILLIQMYSAGN